MTAIIDGLRFRIEFSYRRRDGKRPSLARNSPVRGLSACAIVSDDMPPIVAVAAVMCAASEPNWSRREGRRQAFERAIHDCSVLRSRAAQFAAWFNERFPARVTTVRPKVRLSAEEIERRRVKGTHAKALRSGK